MKTTPAGRFIIVLMMMAFLCVIQAGQAETCIPMPSLSEALVRYPVSETKNADGSVTELYNRISAEDYDTFNAYLATKGAESGEFSDEHGVLTAEIRAGGASFSIVYDTLTEELKVTYPAGTCSEYRMMLEGHLTAAESFFKEGKTDEAVNEILMIPHYKNYRPAQALLLTDTDLAAAVTNREAELAPYRIIGNTVTFGSYEQDRSTKNGPEPIEWIVLDYDETTDRPLLVSRYGLVSMPYNENAETDTTWETCSLRKKLNSLFLDEAFNVEEQAAIAVTEVDNSQSQGFDGWNTSSGNNTLDRVFLLSYAEAKQYLGADDGVQSEAARISATPYANANGGAIAAKAGKAKTAEGKQAVWWWLRSPGSTQISAMTVLNDGSTGSFNADLTQGVVRPALWLNLRPDNALPLVPTSSDKKTRGILPSHTEIEGIGLPSVAEALARYPDSETKNADGSVTEVYTEITEEDYDAFSGWLREQGARLGDHKTEDGVLTAEIKTENAFFIFIYDSGTDKAEVTYPAGTFNAWGTNSKKLLNSAKLFLEDGEQDNALAEFLKIPNFRENAPAEQFLLDHPEFEAAVVEREELVRALQTTGSRVTFGRYEQDVKSKGQQQPIEWIVLDYDGNEDKALLLSWYSLDIVQYNATGEKDITWETCTLRNWLNNDFLNEAFTPDEQSAILITEVDNGPSQAFQGCTDGGNNTLDKLFLLSYAEVNLYMGVEGNAEARAPATSAVMKRPEAKSIARFGVGRSTRDEKTYFWLLRSPADKPGNIMTINQDGYVHTWMDNGYSVFIRPAAWVDVQAVTGVLHAHAAPKGSENGLLPSRNEITGVGMPSLSEALHQYPDSETINGDGSVTEVYTGIFEEDYGTFSVYLEQQGAELGDYQVQGGVLTAEIKANGASFSLKLDSDSGETEITYPAGSRDSWTARAKKLVGSAQRLLQRGKLNEAVIKTIKIPQYRKYAPVKDLIRENPDLAAALASYEEKLVPYQTVGDILTFGRYEQDLDYTNGPEAIEWIVLDYDEKENRTLLLSRYCLEAVGYSGVDWESSYIREFLNRKFKKNAFTAEEQAVIPVTEVDNSKAHGLREWNTSSGSNTQDQIFLLSYAEAERYLGATMYDDSLKPRAAVTNYALKTGAGVYFLRWHSSSSVKTADGERTAVWWLRSKGSNPEKSLTINGFGRITEETDFIGEYFARPVLWLDLNEISLTQDQAEGEGIK